MKLSEKKPVRRGMWLRMRRYSAAGKLQASHETEATLVSRGGAIHDILHTQRFTAAFAVEKVVLVGRNGTTTEYTCPKCEEGEH